MRDEFLSYNSVSVYIFRFYPTSSRSSILSPRPPRKADAASWSTIPTSATIEEQPGLHIGIRSNQRTRNQFRPRVTGKGGTTSYQLRQYAEATLGGGSLRKVVKLPEGEDENEWLAVNSEAPLTIE